jgi:hypothetical protein
MSFTKKIIVAMILGIITGVFLNIFSYDTSLSNFIVINFFNIVSDLFISALKLVIIPLIFFSIVCGIISLSDDTSLSRLGINEKVAGLEDTVMLIVSSDLPFAMKRFCTSESLDNVMPVSMMRSRNFAKDYGVLLVDGPLSGITTRAIVTISKDNKVLHSELVTEIADEPNYQAALDSIK